MQQQPQQHSASPGVTVSPVSSSRYTGRVYRYASIAMIAFGSLSMLCNIIDLSIGSTFVYSVDNGQSYRLYFASYSVSGHGLWSGIIYIAGGCVGLAAARNNTKRLMITFLVLLIISCVISVIQLIISLVATVRFRSRFGPYFRTANCDHCDKLMTVFAMEVLLAVLALLVFVVSLATSVFWCIALRPSSTQDSTEGHATYSAQRYNGENMVSAANDGYGYERFRDPPAAGCNPQSRNGGPTSSDNITGITNPVYGHSEGHVHQDTNLKDVTT